jgi:hypothetical protein
VRALFHGVGDHAVDADGREKHGKPCEDAQQTQPETIVRRRVEQPLFHPSHAVYGYRRVDVGHDLAHGVRHPRRIDEVRAYGEVHACMQVERARACVIR